MATATSSAPSRVDALEIGHASVVADVARVFLMVALSTSFVPLRSSAEPAKCYVVVIDGLE